MSFNCIRLAPVILPVLLLAACNTVKSHIGDEDASFGESVKYDQAIQTVNPVPVTGPGAAQPGGSGAKGQAAVKRYRTDAVKQVEATQTTTGSAGSGGSTPH
jgi:hypothetical protein